VISVNGEREQSEERDQDNPEAELGSAGLRCGSLRRCVQRYGCCQGPDPLRLKAAASV
jgi:hypothetical protein